MKLSVHPMTLNLRTTFRVSHGASDQRHNVLAKIEHNGLTGYGEAAAVPYYGDTQESLSAYLNSLPPLGDDPFALEAVLNSLPDGSHAAQAAVDIALHDLWGKLLGQPLYKLFGLTPLPLPPTSFTIGSGERCPPAGGCQRRLDSRTGFEFDSAPGAVRPRTHRTAACRRRGWTFRLAA